MDMKNKNMLALAMVLFSTIIIAKNDDEHNRNAFIVISDMEKISHLRAKMIEINFVEKIYIQYNNMTASVTCNPMFEIPTDISIQSLYLDAFEMGVQSMIDLISADPIRVFFIKDPHYSQAVVKCNIDYEQTFFRDQNNKIITLICQQ